MVKELKIKNTYLDESKSILKQIKKAHYVRKVEVVLETYNISIRHNKREYVFEDDSVLSDIIEALNIANYDISYHFLA